MSATSATMFRYTKTLKGTFEKYKDVSNIWQFWDFMENDLVDGLYDEEWYNEGTDVPFPCPNGRIVTGIFSNNKLCKLYCTYI